MAERFFSSLSHPDSCLIGSAEREVELIPGSGAAAKKKNAGGGNRTHMDQKARGILSPVRLPVSPLRHCNKVVYLI